MAWIKRNLFFLIGSLIAVALMVLGVFYLLGQINAESEVTDDITKQYAELSRLAHLNPHPGNDKIDNIKAAREQEAELRGFIKKERGLFQPIDPIPNAPSNKISNADFARELRNTVAELRRSATNQSVELPAEYYFSFEAQKKSLIFEPGSLDQLAMHLGEIKALCDVLFRAKINLDGIQREIVSTNQDSNPADYLPTKKTVSTPLADVTPYQVTFRCFSADLAQVLSSLATSPYGFMVESINIEPVNAAEEGVAGSPFAPPPVAAAPGQPPYLVPVQPGGAGYREGMRRGPGIPPPGVVPTAAPPAPVARTQDFLKEKQFRVILMVEVVKPRPEAKLK
jgi:hypothetical protein